MKDIINEQTKELIAIGASIGAHCQPCLDHHVGKAKSLGVTMEQIEAAMGIGEMVEKGAMLAMRDFAKNMLTRTKHNSSECCNETASASGKCCCE